MIRVLASISLRPSSWPASVPFKVILIWCNDHFDDDKDGMVKKMKMINLTKTGTKEDASYRFQGKLLTGLILILRMMNAYDPCT